MKNCVYMVSNNFNNKKYIGRTINFKKRIREHKSAMKSLLNNNPLYFDMEKFGFKNFYFTILEDNISNDDILEKEDYYSIKYNSIHPNGYNKAVRFRYADLGILKEKFLCFNIITNEKFIWEKGVANFARKYKLEESSIGHVLSKRLKLAYKEWFFTLDLNYNITNETLITLLKTQNQKYFKGIRLEDNYQDVGYNQVEFSKKYNLKKKQINKVLNKKTKSHFNWYFEYISQKDYFNFYNTHTKYTLECDINAK